ncbi:P450-derived glycosyltransferase activator [Micromonospora ureilytica]|uniref:cytochrome P450 family protein n=1 Tax=Micromonospora ureilytica TaxID=709868 RepID=UPI0033FC97D9
MAAHTTDAELGRVLLTHRGIQWIIGTKDDPYALLLRCASDDPHELGSLIRQRGPLYLSSAEAWVTAHHDIGAAALDASALDPRPTPADTASTDDPHRRRMPWEIPTLREILPVEAAFRPLGRADYERLLPLADPVLGTAALCERQETVRGIHSEVVAAAGGEPDLLHDIAHRAAVRVVATLLEVPDEAEFARLCRAATGTLDATLCPPHLRDAPGLLSSVGALRDLTAARVTAGAGIAGRLREALASAGETDEAAVAVGTLLAVPGVELSANLVANAVAALLATPDQWTSLVEQPELAEAAVEETLRHSPPVRLQPLFATADVELAGVTVPAGAQVVVAIEAANRDPEIYPDAWRFDVSRFAGSGSVAAPLGLRGTPDLALIAPLVRLQAVSALQVIATELPQLRPVGTAPARLRSPMTRGHLRFPVIAR